MAGSPRRGVQRCPAGGTGGDEARLPGTVAPCGADEKRPLGWKM